MSFLRLACGLLTLLIFTGHTAAQTSPTLTTLYTFGKAPSPSSGTDPLGVVIGSDGVLYGVAQQGGAAGYGTVFSLTPPASPGGAWTETVLYNFTGGSDGGEPSGVVVGSGPGGRPVLYGTTMQGGSLGGGTVFSLTPPAAGGAWTESVLYTFAGGNDGVYPASGVVIGGGGVLYGTTSGGGTGDSGTVFSLTPPASAGGAWTETVLYSFTGGLGGTIAPTGVVIGAGGVLYGATQYGGTGTARFCIHGCGTVFSLTPPKGAPSGPGGAWTATVLYNFTGGDDGFQPSGVVIGSGPGGHVVLYGTTNEGGAAGLGTVFSLTPPAGGISGSGGTWIESVLYSFPASANGAAAPGAGVVIGSGGVLYGTTTAGGASKYGVVFSLTPPASAGGTWTESVLYSFSSGGGSQPFSGLVIGKGGVIYGATAAGTIYSLTPPTGGPSGPAGAWTESVLYSFTGPSPGIGVVSGVVIGNGGVLYGTTQMGGTGPCPTGCGTVFSLTPPASGPHGPGAWTANVLYSFTGGSDGAYPVAGVVIGSGPGGRPVLYGTASSGGARGSGVVFSLTSPTSPGGAWTETTLYSFNPGAGICYPLSVGCSGYTDGASPTTGVVIGSSGELYGTTMGGGTAASGTAFSLTPPGGPGGSWTEAVLYNFSASIQLSPISAGPSGLVIGSGGVLYGTTRLGGNVAFECMSGCGTVFSLTPPASPGGAWAETALSNFTPGGSAGYFPSSGVVIGSGGILYGTTGSVYSLTPPSSAGGDWTEATLYTFTGAADGASPNGVAIGSGPGGLPVLYGTTQAGGSGPCLQRGTSYDGGCGVVFSLTPPGSSGGAWTETVLYAFENGSDGANPSAGVVIGSDGTLYGTTQTANGGTVFSLEPGTSAGPRPSINPGGVVNAASFTTPLAPGSIATAFGDFLLSSPLSATQSPLPFDISGLSLEFGDTQLAPLFFVSGGQVNFQVPWELPIFSQSTLTATLNGLPGGTQTVSIGWFAPAIFTTNGQGFGQGAILDPSYRLVDSSNPATAGATTVLIFCTGLADVNANLPTGSPAPLTQLLQTVNTPTVTIGGLPANVSFSGLAPGYVGLYQVNAQVPAGVAASNAVPVVLSMGGATSNTVTIAVK